MVRINTTSLPKPKTVAIIFDTFLSTLQHSLLLGVAKYANEHRNFNMRCMDVAEIESGNGSLRDCDGLICALGATSKIETLKATGLPIVDINCEKDDPGMIGVDIDGERAGTMAAEWFLRRNFKRFAYCGLSPARNSRMIMKGFSETLENAGLGCIPFDSAPPAGQVEPFTGHVCREQLMPELERWIPTLPQRTAVLCQTDTMASNVLQMCMRLGRSVPDDIAIMGIGNDIVTCTCAPVAITSIDTNMHGVGYAAIRLMKEVLTRPVEPKLRPVFRVRPGAIYERESTAVYPVDPPWLAKTLLSLDTNMGEPISIADIADAAGVSQPTLQATFRKSFGMSAGKYILTIKMREARRLMGEGTLCIKEIAARTGFSSPNYFCRAYKSYYGRPPSEDSGFNSAE